MSISAPNTYKIQRTCSEFIGDCKLDVRRDILGKVFNFEACLLMVCCYAAEFTGTHTHASMLCYVMFRSAGIPGTPKWVTPSPYLKSVCKFSKVRLAGMTWHESSKALHVTNARTRNGFTSLPCDLSAQSECQDKRWNVAALLFVQEMHNFRRRWSRRLSWNS